MDQPEAFYSINQIIHAMRVCRIGHEYRTNVVQVLTNLTELVEVVEKADDETPTNGDSVQP